MWPNFRKRFQITHFYFIIFIAVTWTVLHFLHYFITLHGIQCSNYQNCAINTLKYIRISRNIIEYMLKYTGFHVWFGTIFQDSVTNISYKIIIISYTLFIRIVNFVSIHWGIKELQHLEYLNGVFLEIPNMQLSGFCKSGHIIIMLFGRDGELV